MTNVLDKIKQAQVIERPVLRVGYFVRVHQKIKEGDKERTQIFPGMIISIHRAPGAEATFTVRRIGTGKVGVERIFPLHLPTIAKIEIVSKHKVRRAKLYYLRNTNRKLRILEQTKKEAPVKKLTSKKVSKPKAIKNKKKKS